MAEKNNDYVASNLLLCTETKNLCFDDLDCLVNNDDQKIQENTKVLNFNEYGGRSMALIDLLLPSLSEESFCFMVEREKKFLPKDSYLKRLRTGDLDLNLRREALNWIWKAHVHYGFGELSFCLSINYLDRFLSLYELPRSKSWTIQLLAVACLSLAVKMEEINVPLTVDLQVGEPKFLFEGIDFLEFRPSEIAAAVAMSVSGERAQADDIDKAMPCFSIQVEKDRVMKCLELIQDLTLVSGSSATTAAASVPQSPNAVLEAACLSYKSGEGTVGSCPNSSNTNSTDAKRRKLDTNIIS
ncbi:hypothetical protein RND71_014885 [Anisodus tanguticus]|uniref:Cyclin-like domain-containing protein n=1 Tax=Anisodus tanguticus TaxID=243964 RepID=A0AAE1SBF8_9SOLA|nr:hypothetical protein RND71_014885 [Anisodus tanguticus]